MMLSGSPNRILEIQADDIKNMQNWTKQNIQIVFTIEMLTSILMVF